MAYKALSWGCGVQSTTLAVMSVLGDAVPLDMVITADTGWERQATYEARDFYTQWLRERGVKVEILQTGNVRVDGAENHIHIPFWTESGGPLQRQCTANFKILPIRRRLRELTGFKPSTPPCPPAGSIELWMGISLDEYTRMSHSRVQFIKHRFPLVEKRISRNECESYLSDRGLPVPVKSACVGCPYRLASEWLELKADSPVEFADAVAFDEKNRHNPLASRGASTADALYIYKKARALAGADLEADAMRERQGKQLPLMICESGYCMT